MQDCSFTIEISMGTPSYKQNVNELNIKNKESRCNWRKLPKLISVVRA
jgi:hypothetical protein